MPDRTPDDLSERRLDELRREAERRGRVDGPAVVPPGAPLPAAGPDQGYYGLPVLKPPVWTWEVPAYFFVGGTAGAAAVVATVARGSGEIELARAARWVAALGGAASAPLLVSDLGRPERVLAMLRVFKPQSPMSLGAWTLLAFSHSAAAAAFADAVDRRLGGSVPVRLVGDAAQVLSTATGLVMATYTGVLVGATAIPVWSGSVGFLPPHFGASAVASAVSVLELLGYRQRALNRLGLGAAAVETVVGADIELRRDRALDPLKHGPSGRLTRLGGVLSGPVPLLLRALFGRSPAMRQAAAVSSLVGSILTRFAWLAAGSASAEDPHPPLALPAGRGVEDRRSVDTTSLSPRQSGSNE